MTQSETEILQGFGAEYEVTCILKRLRGTREKRQGCEDYAGMEAGARLGSECSKPGEEHGVSVCHRSGDEKAA